MESDSINIVNIFTWESDSLLELKNIIKQIWVLANLWSDVFFNYINRGMNKDAHLLAHRAMSLGINES